MNNTSNKWAPIIKSCRVCSPFYTSVATITLRLPSECLYVGLALEGEYNVEGATPPFVDNTSDECEYVT